jgi:GAF domain-containing protein
LSLAKNGFVPWPVAGECELVLGERRLRILTRLAGGAAELETKHLCEVCVAVTGTSGAGIMLMSDDAPRGSVCTTNDVSALIEELQFELGEGPCVDAYQQDRPVLEPDLAAPINPRWVAFTGPAVDAGARAVFGFPLHIGAVRLGALNLYCDQPGRLTDEQHADALMMADVAADAILMLQSNAPPGKLAEELLAGANFHAVVHQASGMVAAQLEISVGQALIRLRAHAFGNDRPVAEVARDVVGRTLRFDAKSGEKDHAP